MIPKSSATRCCHSGKIISAPILYGMLIFENVYRGLVGSNPVITAIMDGVHMEGSLHYTGNAVDFRANDLAPEMVVAVVAECKKYLDADFDVIAHGEGLNFHFHMEFDPK